MKSDKIAVIGSCVCDVIIRIPHLPTRTQDIHVESQTMALGGCAFNCAQMLALFQSSYALFSPIGTGIYADFVRKELKQRYMSSMLSHVEGENGCCYCMVEDDGERTFLAYHGCEYKFTPDMFQLLDHQFDTVYICGLELEEDTGIYIIDYLEQHPNLTIYFAPGPRIQKIPNNIMERMWQLHPILHLNDEEACLYTQCQHLKEAIYSLYTLTKQAIIVTQGAKGALLYNQKQFTHFASEHVDVKDTIGAGDAHIGTIMALRQQGTSFEEAIKTANKVSAAVISTIGATIHKDDIINILNSLETTPLSQNP